MKILHFIGSFDIGGQERTLLNLLKLQNDKEKISDVYVFRDRGPLKSQFHSIAKCLTSEKVSFGYLNFIKNTFNIIKIIRQGKYDLIQFYHYSTVSRLWVFLKFFTNVKISYFIGSQGHNKTRFQIIHIKTITKIIDLVIVNSHSICNAFNLNKDSDKLFLLENILPVDLFNNEINNSVISNEVDCNVGIVGRLDPVKRHDVFLKIAKRISKLKNNINFLIYGSGPMLSNIQKTIIQLDIRDKVRIFTDKNDIREIYNNIDIFLLTSDSEGFSNAIMEAMLFGIPCVVTNVGGNPDIINHEENGFLFPKENINYPSKIILDLINDEKKFQKISKNCYEFIYEKYNPINISNNLLKKYDSIL